MAPRAPSGSMTMATRSGPAAGDLSLSELKEFAGFPAATQRYIRRSLDIGLERADAIARWSRDLVEETAIRVQVRVSPRLVELCAPIPAPHLLHPDHAFSETVKASVRGRECYGG